MPYKKSKVFDDWWPLAQSLQMARGSIERVANALESLCKERPDSQYRFEWVQIPSLDALFRETKFDFGTSFYILPTHSEWTVLWDNNYLVNRNQTHSCLATFFGMEALSFSSSDVNSITLAGTTFEHCRPSPNGPPHESVCRFVYCANQGSRWSFYVAGEGEPLPEEDLARYQARRKRDRFNEEGLMALLARLGARPWDEDFYDLAGSKCFRATCVNLGEDHCTHDFAYIRARATGGKPIQEEDLEIEGPPDYLEGRCKTADATGPGHC